MDKESSQEELRRMRSELSIHKSLSHERVIQFKAGFIVELDDGESFVPGVYILMEYAACGDLFREIGNVYITMFRHCLHGWY